MAVKPAEEAQHIVEAAAELLSRHVLCGYQNTVSLVCVAGLCKQPCVFASAVCVGHSGEFTNFCLAGMFQVDGLRFLPLNLCDMSKGGKRCCID